jgi:transcriptional activator of cad operon
MDLPTPTMLRIGDWCVNPSSAQISRNGETTRVEARTMRLLLCLAARAGEVVSIDDLLNEVWPDVVVAPDSVYQAVTSLRRLLGDDAKKSTYVATVPRLGYRMVARVSAWEDSPVALKDLSKGSLGENPLLASPGRAASKSRLAVGLGISLVAIVFVALAIFLSHRKLASSNASASTETSRTAQSVAVLPFLDLTEGMQEETFADGMTEELIDKLSKAPGLRIPAPTASFYFKNKQIPIADIAKTLGVAYVLDGSVRKSGRRLRVAARLSRADNGYVMWTETYDRPFEDIITVQDDIAGEVTKALRLSIVAKPGPG